MKENKITIEFWLVDISDSKEMLCYATECRVSCS